MFNAARKVLKEDKFLQMLMRLFMDVGDPILCDEYTYPHVPESLVIPMGFVSVGIRIDEHGIIPGHLLETLERMQASGAKMPKLLYTIPIGQNPTGRLPFTPLTPKPVSF